MVMEVVFYDVCHGLRKVAKDSVPVARKLWNYPGRYGVVAAAGAVEATAIGGLAILTAAKATIEYGIAKPLWWGTRGIGWLGAHGINLVTGGYCNVPSPGMRFNWGTAGADDRPGWMDWFRHNGNFRAAGWRWLRPDDLPRSDFEEHEDGFDRMNIYNSTKPHSLEWHKELNWYYSNQVALAANRLLNDYLTPWPPAGGNYVDAQGIVVIPPGGGWTGPGGIPGPNDANADRCYRYPDMAFALMNPNQAERNKAYKAVLDTAVWFVQISHLRQVEEQEWRRGVKIAEDIQRTITRAQALEEILEFENELRKRSYGIDDAVMNILTSIASAF